MARVLALLPLLSVGLVACPSQSEDSGDVEACDLSAAASVQVVVAASDGSPPPSAGDNLVLRYAVDGGEFADCVDTEDASFVCGYEEIGRFVIQGNAEGYEQAEIAVDIQLDAEGCHPMTRSVELVFLPLVESD